MSKQVAIVGFGYIGACIGAVLAEKRYQVVGIDNRPQVIEEINRGEISINEPGLGDLVRESVAAGRLSATEDFAAIQDADVILVTVGTPLGMDLDPDTTQIKAAATEVGRHLRPGQLVILKSTVPPNTTERVVMPILEEESGLVVGRDFFLAFCPERLAEGRALHEFQTIPVVVGGVNRRSTEMAVSFWREALDVPVLELSNARTAEMTKLADNLWIDLSIALGNELALLSERLDIDVLEVLQSANSLPKGKHNVNILLPSMGVGGACLTKDPWFVHHLANQHGLEMKTPVVSRTVNDSMPRHTFELIEHGLSAAGKTLEASTVAVLGLSFKNNTGDVRFTPTKGTIELLEKSGCQLKVCDPWVSPQDAKQVTDVELTSTIEATIEGADCLAFLAGHDDFHRISLEEVAELANPGCVVVDGRMYFPRSQIERMNELGLRYRGIGR